ncbi:MAG: 3-hydroxyacyl-ACP dehydratase FabZ [Nitrospirota bacterium]|nr:3-hydroxyacyl-ACP dehydratase FabZ [Nitrospirota bacterium]
MIWDREKIESVLPQREPFLFIDEVIEIIGTEKVVAVKHVRNDAGFFEGHFPGRPVMPGVLLIEAMAQASIILYSLDRPEVVKASPEYYLGKVRAEFLSPVYPGDKLTIETNRVKFLDNAAITDVTAKVNDKIAVRANLVFSIQRNE